MASNPTQLTPPRVAVLDPRTGAISREWYRFFLSLLNATQVSEEASTLVPEAAGNATSFDAVASAAIQALQSSLPSAFDAATIQADLQALALQPPAKQFATPRYGSFYDTTTQSAAVINTAYAMTFNTVDLSFGVTRGSPTSRIFVDRPNIYNVQFSAQLDKTAGGTGIVYIWLRKNGVNVPASAGFIQIQGNNAELLAAWNYLVPLNAGDYIELMWEVSDITVQIAAQAATGVHPSVPSVILTVSDNISSMEV